MKKPKKFKPQVFMSEVTGRLWVANRCYDNWIILIQGDKITKIRMVSPYYFQILANKFKFEHIGPL